MEKKELHKLIEDVRENYKQVTNYQEKPISIKDVLKYHDLIADLFGKDIGLTDGVIIVETFLRRMEETLKEDLK